MREFLQQPWTQRSLFFLLIFILWDLSFRFGWYQGDLFPGPQAVGDTFVRGMTDGSFAAAVWVSLKRLLFAFFVSVVLGVVSGTLLAASKTAKNTIGSVLTSLQALPSICWLPFALLWFGVDEGAVTFVTVMGSFLAITTVTEDAVRNVPPLMFRAGNVLGAKGWRLYWHVVLPAALPNILSGLKLGWSFAWRALMAGELIVASVSLGNLLSQGRALNDMSLIFCVMALIIVVGLSLDRLVFGVLERIVRQRWGYLATN
jgi:NitT/TauT family transport system permease protein